MYCKILTDVTKASPHKSTNQNALQVLSRTHNQFADVLQVPSRRHKDNRRCIARSLQMSQRQSPMYCKILTDVTKTIADVLQDLNRRHKGITAQVNQSECFASSQQNSQPIRRCFASSKQTSQRQSPMYCKVSTDVTKTIADVLQDLYRIHKDNRRCNARSL